MKFTWNIEPLDVEQIKQFIESHSSDYFVQARAERNLSDEPRSTTIDVFWVALITCLLSSQQRSGPNSPISNFIRLKPFPLSYAQCTGSPNPRAYAHDNLKRFGGIRRSETIAEEISGNLAVLGNGFWGSLSPRLQSLNSRETERETARLLSRYLKGIGPKQSRNLLQMLGLTRHEIPIDSRIVKYLKKIGFPVPLSAVCLSDPDYYEFIMDGIQHVCSACGVYPCILDACVFVSYDGDGWNESNIIY